MKILPEIFATEISTEESTGQRMGCCVSKSKVKVKVQIGDVDAGALPLLIETCAQFSD